jgi:hypothetical protein
LAMIVEYCELGTLRWTVTLILITGINLSEERPL